MCLLPLSPQVAKAVIEELRILLPIKIDKMKVALKVFPEYAAKAYGSIKGFGTITKEEWQADGSLVALVEMPAGLYSSFIDRLGKLTQGTVQTKVLK